MTFGKPFKMRQLRHETRRQRQLREARELEKVPEDQLTDDEQVIVEAYADYENNAFDRANDR